MDISSMMRRLHLRQVWAAAGRDASSMERLRLWSPAPIPAKECNVTPPIRQAATPVEAVMMVPSGGNVDMILRNRNDFPVPALPVKKTLKPCKQAKQT